MQHPERLELSSYQFSEWLAYFEAKDLPALVEQTPEQQAEIIKGLFGNGNRRQP